MKSIHTVLFSIPLLALSLTACLPEARGMGVLDALLVGALATESDHTRAVLASSVITLSGHVTDGNEVPLERAELKLVRDNGEVLVEGVYSDSLGEWSLELKPFAVNFNLFLHVYRGGSRAGVYALEISIDPTDMEISVVARKAEGDIEMISGASLAPRIILGRLPSTILEGVNHPLTLVYGRAIAEPRSIRLTSSSASMTINGKSTEELRFTPGDWNLTREVIIDFAHDANLVDERVVITIEEPGHRDLKLPLTIKDRDNMRILLSAFNTTLNEGDIVTGQVCLSNQPEGPVDLVITTDDPGAVSVNASTLTFTPENYNIPRDFQLRAEQDVGLTDEKARVTFTIPSMPQVFSPFRDVTVADDETVAPPVTLTAQNRGRFPRGRLVNGKLVLVTAAGVYPNHGPVLTICNPDGTGCIERQFWSGFGYHPDLAYDAVNDRLLITSYGGDNIYLFRCTSDGVTCDSYYLIYGGGPYIKPRIKIDTVNNKFLVVYKESRNYDRLGLIRCNLDVTGCVRHDVLAGQGNATGHSPRLHIDYVNNKLLITSGHLNGDARHALFRCDLDATNCMYTNLTGSVGTNWLGSYYSSGIDTTRNRLVLAGEYDRLMDCALDGSDCGLYSVFNLRHAYFMMHHAGKTLLLESNHYTSASDDPVLRSCDPRAANCVSYTFSGGPALRGASMLRDDANQRYIILMEDSTNSAPAVLYSMPYNFGD